MTGLKLTRAQEIRVARGVFQPPVVWPEHWEQDAPKCRRCGEHHDRSDTCAPPATRNAA